MENREVLEKLVQEWNTYSMAYKFYLEISHHEQTAMNRYKAEALRDLIYNWFGKNSVQIDYVPGHIFDIDFRYPKMEVV